MVVVTVGVWRTTEKDTTNIVGGNKVLWTAAAAAAEAAATPQAAEDDVMGEWTRQNGGWKLELWQLLNYPPFTGRRGEFL